MIREIPPNSPTNISGAEEVWGSGGKVYVVELEMDGEGKFSTSEIIQKMVESII